MKNYNEFNRINNKEIIDKNPSKKLKAEVKEVDPNLINLNEINNDKDEDFFKRVLGQK